VKKPSKYNKKFTNDSGEDIPGFSVMRISSVSDAKLSGTGIKYTVGKPDTSDNQVFLINGYTKVFDGGPGIGMAPHFDDFIAAYDEGDAEAPPTVGEEWGPDESWNLKSTGTGFTIVGGGADGRVVARLLGGGGGGGETGIFLSRVQSDEVTAAGGWNTDPGEGTIELIEEGGGVAGMNQEVQVENPTFDIFVRNQPLWYKKRIVGAVTTYIAVTPGCGLGPEPEI
jgi:hypothetical protein